jgi:putative transport protein
MQPVSVRTYEIEKPNVAGHRLDELRTRHPQISVERILRGDAVLEPRDDLVLQLRDTIALYGEIPLLVAAGPRIGPEVYDRVASDVGLQTVDIVVGRPSSGKTLEELASGVGHGLYLNAMFHAGDIVPHGPKTVVHKGDVLRVTGTNYRIKLLEQLSGTMVKPSLSTDIVTLALGAALGGLIGMITIPAGHLRLQVGSAVGLLLVGIVLSILRTRYPGLGGPYPEPARRLIEDLGLNVFCAVLGLNAGSGVITALAQGAIAPILIICLIVGFVPATVAWLVWTRVFHMNDALLLGAIAGGRCNSAGMQASQEATHSAVPAISYPATFAISNILFTTFAYVFALLD